MSGIRTFGLAPLDSIDQSLVANCRLKEKVPCSSVSVNQEAPFPRKIKKMSRCKIAFAFTVPKDAIGAIERVIESYFDNEKSSVKGKIKCLKIIKQTINEFRINYEASLNGGQMKLLKGFEDAVDQTLQSTIADDSYQIRHYERELRNSGDQFIQAL